MNAKRLRLALVVMLAMSAAASSQTLTKCPAMGGMILTDLGVWDPSSTFGYATGDLKGSVGVTILST